MWYFAWMLGTGFACAFAILNALWLEAERTRHGDTGEDLEDG